MKEIAFFDFDGTITTKDTLLEFIKFMKGKGAFYRGFLLNAPYLIAYKIGVISNQRAKERIIEHFFKSSNAETFDEDCRKFCATVLPGLIRPAAAEEIKKLIGNGTKIVIVTASAENWVKPWADSLTAEVIGTRLESKDGYLTGKIRDVNCHGDEKVRRIKEKFFLADYGKVLAYGDTNGDKPMLKIAHESFYKPFR